MHLDEGQGPELGQPGKTRGEGRAWIAAAAIALAFIPCAAGQANAEPPDLASLFPGPRGAPSQTPSGQEILRRALENLLVDAQIAVELERAGPGDAKQRSTFLLYRRRLDAANRLLFVGVAPEADRGRRVLHLDYDDGRDETFVFAPGAGQGPVRASYRVADPFISTWHEIEAGETARELRALAEYEVCGLRTAELQGEATYQLSLQSLTPRGYARTELSIAASDFALLEKREYEAISDSAPKLIASMPRGSIVRFGQHSVSERMRYRYPENRVQIDVRLRHEKLPENGDGAFYPGTFHLAPVAAPDSIGP